MRLPRWHQRAHGAELGFSSAHRSAPRDPKSHFSLTKLNARPPSPRTAAPTGGDAVGTTRAHFDAVDPTAMARGKTREVQRSSEERWAAWEASCAYGDRAGYGATRLLPQERSSWGVRALVGFSLGSITLVVPPCCPARAPCGTSITSPSCSPGSPASRERAADGEEQAAGREPSHLPPAL